MSFEAFKNAVRENLHCDKRTVDVRSRVTPRGFRFLLGEILVSGAPGAHRAWVHVRGGNGKFNMNVGFPIEVLP